MIDDITVLSLLSGSDYLPRVYGFSLKKSILFYRSLRKQPQFADRYIVQRITGENPNDAAGWEIDGSLLRDIVAFADQATKTYDTLVLKVNGKDRRLVLSSGDPKSNLNALTASLVKSSKLFYESTAASLGRTTSSVFLEYSSGKRLLLGRSESSSQRLSQREAARAALLLDGPLMTHICSKVLDSESIASLRSYFISAEAASGTDSSTEDDEASPLPSTHSTVNLGLSIAARRPTTTPSSEISLAAARTANEPALLLEYLRMVVWTLEYYQGVCRGYTDFYHFSGAPSCDVIGRVLLPGTLRVPFDADGGVYSPQAEVHPLPIAPVPQVDAPLVPLAFFVSLMPPASAAIKALPQYFYDLVLEFRAGDHRDILGMSTDKVLGRHAFVDLSKLFIKTVSAAISKDAQLDSAARNELKGFIQFSPSYVFVQPTKGTSDDLAASHITLQPVLSSQFAWPRLIEVAKKISTHSSSTVCLAEAPSSLSGPRKGRSDPRKFSATKNPFMQRRNYSIIRRRNPFVKPALARMAMLIR